MVGGQWASVMHFSKQPLTQSRSAPRLDASHRSRFTVGMSSSHAVSHRRQLQDWAPFGLGQVKPKHFRDMMKIAWENRDNLGYAWQVLSKGVCDGCALGVAGFHDWTVKGPHLCMTRLNLLRLNTMPELDHRLLADAAGLARQSAASPARPARLPDAAAPRRKRLPPHLLG